MFKLYKVRQVCNPSTEWEGSGAQDDPRLDSELETSLGYMRVKAKADPSVLSGKRRSDGGQAGSSSKQLLFTLSISLWIFQFVINF